MWDPNVRVSVGCKVLWVTECDGRCNSNGLDHGHVRLGRIDAERSWRGDPETLRRSGSVVGVSAKFVGPRRVGVGSFAEVFCSAVSEIAERHR
jgi:hypothetical protein